MRTRRFFHVLILVTLCASFFGPFDRLANAQTPLPPAQVQELLNSMTPEEKVGQLFLVTFKGTNADEQSEIYDLIMNHHVGGVILQASNDNFVAEPDTLQAAYQLIAALQNIEWRATISLDSQSVYVPLFIGISQEGDGAPHDQILSGLTPLPTEMAIGATWDTELAEQVGFVLGSELSALGFNLILGPSLDVMDDPNPSAQSDLGTRVFGGDPFWVGKMGNAYISGLHQGSGGRMLVVAKHFPGRGSSDRLPEEEVATVRKSLEQLKQVELTPFFAVTGAPDATANTDGLLVSHIRYQGFQGNIRATTRPVSFDNTALSAILALPQFSTWRANGGLIVSDQLGSRAVREFYSQGGETFSPRLVARDAFLAGNDLLYLGDISAGELDDTYSATLRILTSFAQEYRSDPVFARLVDAAVTRILTHKLRMYGRFAITNVIPPQEGLATIGASQQVALDVARSAATLISPDPQELSTLLPSPPRQTERIVFLTDTFAYKQCSYCLSYEFPAVDTLQKTVLRLYGPEGSGQVFTSRLNSFPLDELAAMLDGTTETNIESVLSNATWIVISLASVREGQLNLLRRFFAERPNLVRNKNVILFSFTAPYYLDATDISKLTAYYALYSKQPAFMDVAARLLFQQVSLQGDSPVSIPAVGYDLIRQTSPDPAQVIPLQLEQPAPEPGGETPTLESVTPTLTPTPFYRIGDTITVRAGPILDHNQHIVPDGTVVRFTMSTRDESGGILQQAEATTVNGVAHTTFIIDKPGRVEIKAVSEPAVVSDVLQFDATSEGVSVTVVVPSVTLSAETMTPTPTPNYESELISPEGHPRLGIWMIIAIVVFGSAFLTLWVVSRIAAPRWGVRFALCVLIGGLAGYNYVALGLPGAVEWIASEAGALGVFALTFVGEAVGLFAAWVWKQWFSEQASRAG
ncbi:MAG TPA: glycoside hydrolase family 3 N-terminal domain-containing protein [Anaerolineales bacterium]|nr:glycoside hydrolase family 3 N-terminal domain-containing protein [Anaerolineales bacterium]